VSARSRLARFPGTPNTSTYEPILPYHPSVTAAAITLPAKPARERPCRWGQCRGESTSEHGKDHCRSRAAALTDASRDAQESVDRLSSYSTGLWGRVAGLFNCLSDPKFHLRFKGMEAPRNLVE
jgi:hypothetical protein